MGAVIVGQLTLWMACMAPCATVLRRRVRDAVSSTAGDECGEIASWVVVTALIVVASIAIVGYVVTKLTTAAKGIQVP
jgi:small-conductance mechanosensitive channel